jgi:Ca2+/Na+ antiporter
MRSDEPRLLENAAGAVILTIVGMLGGLACGLFWAWLRHEDAFRQIGQVVSGAIVGTIIGLGLAVLLAARQRGSFRSVKKTMVFIAAVAVVVWATNTLLRTLFFER